MIQFTDMLNVVCVLRQGGKVGYDASWVDKLKSAVNRHLTIPHRFICLSDCEVNCERIPLIDIGTGFWSKLELFRPGLFTSPVLYIDLDTVICKNIDEIVDRCRNERFVMWLEKDKNIHSSASGYAITPDAALSLIKFYRPYWYPADNAINQFLCTIQIHNYIMGRNTLPEEGNISMTKAKDWL